MDPVTPSTNGSFNSSFGEEISLASTNTTCSPERDKASTKSKTSDSLRSSPKAAENDAKEKRRIRDDQRRDAEKQKERQVHEELFMKTPGLFQVLCDPSDVSEIREAVPVTRKRTNSPPLLFSTVPVRDQLLSHAKPPNTYTVPKFINKINKHHVQLPSEHALFSYPKELPSKMRGKGFLLHSDRKFLPCVEIAMETESGQRIYSFHDGSQQTQAELDAELKQLDVEIGNGRFNLVPETRSSAQQRNRCAERLGARNEMPVIGPLNLGEKFVVGTLTGQRDGRATSCGIRKWKYIGRTHDPKFEAGNDLGDMTMSEKVRLKKARQQKRFARDDFSRSDKQGPDGVNFGCVGLQPSTGEGTRKTSSVERFSNPTVKAAQETPSQYDHDLLDMVIEGASQILQREWDEDNALSRSQSDSEYSDDE